LNDSIIFHSASAFRFLTEAALIGRVEPHDEGSAPLVATLWPVYRAEQH
jgi:hypothetical protein